MCVCVCVCVKYNHTTTLIVIHHHTTADTSFQVFFSRSPLGGMALIALSRGSYTCPSLRATAGSRSSECEARLCRTPGKVLRTASANRKQHAHSTAGAPGLGWAARGCTQRLHLAASKSRKELRLIG